MSHKKAWVHTVPFVVEHWDVGMKSMKAARVILGVSILLISLRAADIVRALQAVDLCAWTWKGGNLNTTDTVSFFFLFIEKVSCFRLAHFNILLLVKKRGGWEGSRSKIHKHTLSCLHGCHAPEMAKSGPTHFLSWWKKMMCKRFMCKMTHQSVVQSSIPPHRLWGTFLIFVR